MNWNKLTSDNQLATLQKLSADKDVLIFKHSTRCSISATALSRLERQWAATEVSHIEPFYLDLLSYRPISNQISQIFEVEHQSPQILLIRNGKCVYHASHLEISLNDILAN